VLCSPRLELVGHLVHSREKAGRDAGELIGESAAGVGATADVDDFLAMTPIA
jgi:2,4-diaminopentanoate dehydrogenase